MLTSAINVTPEDPAWDKLVIGIHGLSNKPPKEALERQWLTAMADGLSKYPIGLGPPRRARLQDLAIEFRLAYWADLRYPQPRDTWPPEPIPGSPGPAYQPRRLDDLRIRAIAKLLPVWDRLRGLLPNSLSLRLMNRYLSDLVPDLLAYWAHPDTRQAIGSRLGVQLDSRRKTLVIAHSMGSIIAYDVLQSRDVDALITIGSPLGVPSVWHQGPYGLQYPPLRRWWRNFSDPEDHVAANPRVPLAGVGNQLIWNSYRNPDGTRNPHKSFGYLRSPEVAEAIWDFLK